MSYRRRGTIIRIARVAAPRLGWTLPETSVTSNDCGVLAVLEESMMGPLKRGTPRGS